MSVESKSVEEIIASYSNKETTPENPTTNPEVNTPEETIPNLIKSDETLTGSVDDIIKASTGQDKKAAENIDDATKGNSEDLLSDEVKSSIQTLIESGKLYGFEEGDLNTVADLNDLIEANQNQWQDHYSQQANEQFYSNKTPAWQAVMKYSEMVERPEELMPFLQVMDDIDYTQNLTLDNEEHQEEIVRATGAIKGLPTETIEADILDYKERGILKDRAEISKPVLDQYNEGRAQEMVKAKQQEQFQKEQLMQRHYDLINTNIMEAEDLGGLKLNQQDRYNVASTLVPDESGSLPIFSMIDSLFSQGRFDILSKIALLGTNEESFNNYYQANSENIVANNLQRKLKISNENSFNPSQDVETQRTKPKQTGNESYTLV